MQTIRTTTLTVLALLLSVSPFNIGRAEDAKPADIEWPVARLLPSDTLAMITVAQAGKMTEKFKQTALWRIYTHPDVQKAFQAPLMLAQMGLTEVELKAGVKLADVLSYFNQGEVTFAFLGADTAGPNGEPIPDLLLSIQARDKTQAVLDELSRRVDQANALAGNQLQITETPVGNYTIHRVGVPNTSIAVNYGVCDGNVIVTFGDGIIEKIIALHEKDKAGLLKAGAQPAEALLQYPAYANIAKKAGPDSDLTVYVNIEGLRNAKNLNFRPKNDQQKAEWAFAGLDSVRSLAYTAGVNGPGVREVFVIDAPAAQRSGILALLPSNDGLKFETLARAPRNSVLAVAVKAAPDKMFDRFIELASMVAPEIRQQAEAALAAAGQQAKIGIRKDVFGALTGEAVVSVSIANRNAKLPVGMPQLIVSLSIRDAAGLKNTLASLRAAGTDLFDYSEVDSDGRTIVIAREKFPQGRDPGQFAYAIDGQELLVAFYPLALREELQRRDAAKKNPAGSALTDDPEFKTTAATLSGSPEFFLYADTTAIATALYESLIPVAQLKHDPRVNFAALPPAADLFQNLGGTVFGLSADNDGIVASGYSPGGIVSVLGAAIVGGIAKARANAVGGRAELNDRKHGLLDQVSQSLQAYAHENNGGYPASLSELQPKYLAALEELKNVVFIGKQDKPNKVVAHSSEKLPGPIAVLLQDGAVVDIRRDQLGKTLKEGLSAEARAAGAQHHNGTKGDAPDF